MGKRVPKSDLVVDRKGDVRIKQKEGYMYYIQDGFPMMAEMNRKGRIKAKKARKGGRSKKSRK